VKEFSLTMVCTGKHGSQFEPLKMFIQVLSDHNVLNSPSFVLIGNRNVQEPKIEHQTNTIDQPIKVSSQKTQDQHEINPPHPQTPAPRSLPISSTGVQTDIHMPCTIYHNFYGNDDIHSDFRLLRI